MKSPRQIEIEGTVRDADLSPRPVGRPATGPPLTETRVLDPNFCQPGSPQAFATAYIQLCLDPVEECPEGEVLQPARETRSRPAGDAEWGPWQPLSPATCVIPGEGDLIDDVRRAFAEMTITAPPVTVIDGRGWTFVQIDTIVYSDDTPQTLTTTVGGTPVEIRATPVEWRWDFGDKTKPLTTTKPGGPYPDKTVTHVYTRLGTYTVTLTTTWQGQWRLVGETQWRDVDGQNTTTSTSEPFTTHEIRTRLVTPPG
ncbi:PKD domain-containing protein [Flavimobilis soli]|uniref:PKD domain-containing protein n=1 Tax=Flavimobilis soli TaxID=442709 RepID=UPI001473CD08|nr:PKD domain-containing protein [Flavimobilis soli]